VRRVPHTSLPAPIRVHNENNISNGAHTTSSENPSTSSYRFGYARVSTLDQDEALQHDALMAAGCHRVFVDRVSGKFEHRPALDATLGQLRPGDSVTVWRLDRLGRSLRHLIDVVGDLDQRGVAFRSLTESIDTGTPGSKLTFFHLFGALAEFERDLIRERTIAGLPLGPADAREVGQRYGPLKLDVARSMYESGAHDVTSIARVVGVSRAAVYRALARDPSPRDAPTSGTE
jgi:DNA invertase Pin-like site-specific DNA recombinase